MDPAKAAELERNLATRPERNARVIVGDANEKLVEYLRSWNSRTSRGVVFLDPFAMNVRWSTLEAIARTNSLDLWLLFPIGAVARTMPVSGDIPRVWLDKLISIFGEDPTPHLYETQTHQALFPDEVEEEQRFRRGGIEILGAYTVRRLQTIFRGFVSEQALRLKNSRNSTMFLLMFCSANPSPKAVELAEKVVEDILKRHAKGGGHVQRFGD
ncbi:MAG: three-Cys-motif partner protein TcmP [Holophaga sp.]|jgi:three-Cys-motif partner protein